MKSIVYILDSFPRISETFILNEILEVQSRGIKIIVFAFDKSKYDNKQHEGVKYVKNIKYFKKTTIVTKFKDHINWLLKSPKIYLKALTVILKKDSHLIGCFIKHLGCVKYIIDSVPDNTHAHFASEASNLALLVHLFSGIPFTFTTHRYDIFDLPAKNFPLKTKLAKKHITISEYNRTFLMSQFGLKKSDIEVVHCGININNIKLNSGEREEGLILTVARLAPEKSLDVLLRALSLLTMKGVEFRAVIIGDGPLKEDIENLVRSLKLDENVFLLGSQTQDQVYEWMGKASIMVLSSKSEGIPVSLMEAMAMKTSVIATRITGIPELIEDSIDGLLVEYNDIAALSEAIERLMNDKPMRLKLAESGYSKVVREFALTDQVDKLINIWYATDHHSTI